MDHASPAGMAYMGRIGSCRVVSCRAAGLSLGLTWPRPATGCAGLDRWALKNRPSTAQRARPGWPDTDATVVVSGHSPAWSLAELGGPFYTPRRRSIKFVSMKFMLKKNLSILLAKVFLLKVF